MTGRLPLSPIMISCFNTITRMISYHFILLLQDPTYSTGKFGEIKELILGMIDTYSYESVSPSFKVVHFPVFYSISFCKMLANNRAKSIGTSTFPLHHTSARQLSILALCGSEPGGDHILISTLLIFKCLLYRNKVTASRSSTHRLGCLVYNCKLACSLWKKRTLIKQHP